MKVQMIQNNRRKKSSPVQAAKFCGANISLASADAPFCEYPIGLELEVGEGAWAERSRFVAVMSFEEAERLQKALAESIALRRRQFARGVFEKTPEDKGERMFCEGHPGFLLPCRVCSHDLPTPEGK